MKNARASIPPPKIVPPPASAQAAIQNAIADAPTPKPEPLPAPVPTPPSVEVLADRVVFRRPKIELGEHIFLNDGKTQTKKLEPERAVVAHGILMIDELGLTFPLGGWLIRTN